jgi:hypothetical protein
MSVGRARSAFLVLMLAVASTGCFDVRAVDPGPRVLDDFEDGDLTPSLRPFTEWSCGTFEPSVTIDCGLTEGFESSTSLSVAFSLTDPPDDKQQSLGAFTMAFSDTPIDLTALSAITFDIRLTSVTPLPAGTYMHMDLQCSTAIGDNGVPLADFVVVQNTAFSAEWSSVSLAISNFGPAPWRSEHIRGGAPACLRAIDGFGFVLHHELPDGQTGTGVFSIDNVRLQ